MAPHFFHYVLRCSAVKSPSQRIKVGLMTGFLLLAGCQHRSATDVTADWMHGLEGGEVYRLHPPTPGFDQPYPHIGRTPTTTPEFPSAEARAEITRQLEAQRNNAQRIGASSGPLPHVKSFAPPPPPGNGNNTTLVSQDNHSSNHPPALSSSPSAQQVSSSLPYQPIDHTIPASLPAVTSAPPPPLTFPGFALSSSTKTSPPDFDHQLPMGTLIHFQPETDHITDGQEKTLQALADNRHNSVILIQGFGTALSSSTGLTPDDQQNDIILGLLRARALAQNLINRGVPTHMIQIRGDALGNGARVLYQLR